MFNTVFGRAFVLFATLGFLFWACHEWPAVNEFVQLFFWLGVLIWSMRGCYRLVRYGFKK